MNQEAAISRKMLALVRSSASSRDDEEARAYLQKRLEVFSRIVFWAFVALRILEVILYRTYPEVTPRNYHLIVSVGVCGLIAMATCWRGLLVRRTLSLRALYAIDLTYTTSGGIVFAATAVLAPERHEVAYICLVYTCFVVFMRSLVVPSSARHTLLVSLSAFTPVFGAIAWLAATSRQELPRPVYFVGGYTLGGIAVLIATSGSRIIYGLRRRASQQMQLGQYTLDAKLGEGRLGEVYRARHSLLRRPTAVKLLRPDQIGGATLVRFEHQVQQMSQLTHPNTVAIFDYGHSPDGVFYYAMEYLDGIDLESLVQTYGPQPQGRVIDILVQVCGALDEAQQSGLLHRELRPVNIMLCQRGGVPDVAKLLDFGLDAPEPDEDVYHRSLAGVARFLLGGTLTPALGRVLERRPGSLVDELRAIHSDDWSREDARRWWSVHATAPSRQSTPILTMPIDLERG